MAKESQGKFLRCAIGGEKIRPNRTIDFKNAMVCSRHFDEFNDWANDEWIKIGRIPISFKEYVNQKTIQDFLDFKAKQNTFLKKMLKTLIIIPIILGLALMFLPEEIKIAEGLFKAIGRVIFIFRIALIIGIILVAVIFIGWYLYNEWKKVDG